MPPERGQRRDARCINVWRTFDTPVMPRGTPFDAGCLRRKMLHLEHQLLIQALRD